jgi:hypothetical protein
MVRKWSTGPISLSYITRNQIKSPAWCSVLPVHSLSLPPLSPPRHHGHLTRSFNGNMVRNFPTHGQPSAAQGSLTSCLNFDCAILNLFEPSAPWSDGPEVEHWAHFLILYYPSLYADGPITLVWVSRCCDTPFLTRCTFRTVALPPTCSVRRTTL